MIVNNLQIKIGGEAGMGINAAALLFCKMCSRAGLHIFEYLEYPSLIRGGHNVAQILVGENEVKAQKKTVDLLVALNKETMARWQKELHDQSGIIFDPEVVEIGPIGPIRPIGRIGHQFAVPLLELTKKIGGEKIMENNVALGAAVALLNFDLKYLFSVIEDIFGRKGELVVAENKKAAQAGYDYVRKNYQLGNFKFKLKGLKREKREKNGHRDLAVMTGNEAIGLGALAANCQFYAAYPMTPASSLLHFLADNGPQHGCLVKHAEDEISVINMAIGASFAGVRSMCGTSGGGFALMNEALSLAGISETPIVMVVAQRPGPATGLPTWTEQGDLQYIIRAGHGEFPRIVLAPADVAEAYHLTKEAFNLADIYQMPVIILTDKYLSESHKSVQSSKFKVQSSKINRGKMFQVQSSKFKVQNYLRYQITEDGISPRALPGQIEGFFQANSYEHLEDGHTTEESQPRIKQVDKRNRKMATFLQNHWQLPTVYGEKDADLTLIGWGSVKGPILEAMSNFKFQMSNQAQNPNVKFNFVHFTHVWPVDGGRVAEILEKSKRLLLVENNSTGQLGQLIRQETGIEIKDKLLKYDGRPFWPEEIIGKINQK